MKRLIACLMAVLLLLGLGACKPAREDLRFYVLRQADVTANMSTDMLLHTAKTKGRLAFTGADLEGWLWADHTVRLSHVNVKGSAADGGSVLFQTKAGDTFLLTLGNRVLYTGTFDTDAGGVVITDAGDRDFKVLFQDPYGDRTDPRGNQRLYDFLIDQQLLVSEFK